MGTIYGTWANISLSTSTPIVNETLFISATVTNGARAYLGYRSELGAPFTRLEMYDDGAHNDGGANDGIYAVELPINNSFVQYYVYAENDNAGMFSPQRAEYEYYTITATTSNPTVGDLVINEFMASNDAAISDQDGEFDDWIELYNNSTTTIDLEGYFLSDDADDLMQWAFPAGTFIDGNGYLIVWADNDEDQPGLHANFKLSAAAETIFLVDAAGAIVDEVSYVDQATDISYGRFPNGIGNFQTMNPSFNAENNRPTSTLESEVETIALKASPNPADDSFYLEINERNQKERELLVYGMSGNVLLQKIIFQNTFIDVSTWAAGMYIVRVDDAFVKMVIR